MSYRDIANNNVSKNQLVLTFSLLYSVCRESKCSAEIHIESFSTEVSVLVSYEPQK